MPSCRESRTRVSSNRRGGVWLIAAAAGLFLILFAGAAAGADRVDAAVEAVLADGDYQTELPTDEPEIEVPSWLERLLRWLFERADGSVDRERPFAADLISTLIWLVAIAAGLVALFWLATRLAALRPPEGRETPEGTPEAAGDAVAGWTPSREAAAALAAEGRYADAIHVLLLSAFDLLQGRADVALPDSSTSREVAATATVPDAARPLLAGLVAAVERSYFGARDPDVSDYETCARDHDRFGAALAGET